MYASALTAAVQGMEVCPIHVETDVREGLPYFVMVGFPSAQVKEAQERVRTALNHNGIALPSARITVNFAPADIRKEGARYDLPLAASILAASGRLPAGCLEKVMILGELGLSGEVFPTTGVLPGVMKAREMGCRYCVIPSQNLPEARLVPQIQSLGVDCLWDLIDCLRDPSGFEDKHSTGAAPDPGEERAEALHATSSAYETPGPEEGRAKGLSAGNNIHVVPNLAESPMDNSKQNKSDRIADPRQALRDLDTAQCKPYIPDFQEIRGQETAKRAAEIAASGFHNFLMIGPPGSGKSMIAHRLPYILPALSYEEQLEITRIYSIAGLLTPQEPLMTRRPFRSPHHTCSPQSLAGGGKTPVPGEITLAHRGVLFLDEMPEFGRRTLEILRQPMEDKKIVISRINGVYTFPADFMLVAAMNPCPCGYYPDMQRCACRVKDVASYMSRVSRPLLDRMDLSVRFDPVRLADIEGTGGAGEPSRVIRDRVERMRQLQKDRFEGESIAFNSQMSAALIEKYCTLTPEALGTLRAGYDAFAFSARSYHRILKVSRTIADMDDSTLIREAHISEAIALRVFDSKNWERE